MSDSVQAEGVELTLSVLEREIDHLARRFPDVSRAEISQRMRTTYAELESTASIRTHLITVTAARVANALREGVE